MEHTHLFIGVGGNQTTRAKGQSSTKDLAAKISHFSIIKHRFKMTSIIAICISFTQGNILIYLGRNDRLFKAKVIGNQDSISN